MKYTICCSIFVVISAITTNVGHLFLSQNNIMCIGLNSSLNVGGLMRNSSINCTSLFNGI